MKKSIVLILLFISATGSAQDNSAEDTVARPAISEIGKSDGKRTEIKINKEEGSLKSSDGMVELIIPAGAVAKKTVISIQPIKNLMPNGHDKAYRLEPSGIRFQKPVQLIFHYDEEEIKDSMQLLLGIAMQDDKGQWYSLNKFTLDTVAKTISGNINHFSVWATFSALNLISDKKRVKVNSTAFLFILGVSRSEKEAGGDELSMLDQWKAPVKGVWRVNNIIKGDAKVGILYSGVRDETTFTNVAINNYTAPAKLPDQNPVAVSVDLSGASVMLKINSRSVTFKKLRLVTNILIYDVAFEVEMISEALDQGVGTNIGAVIYRDTGSLVVSLNGREARIIERVNRNISSSLVYSGGCCRDYRIVKSGTGNIHIAGTPVIKVAPPSAPGKSAIVEIIFSRVPSIFPLFQVTCQCPGERSPTTSTNGKGVAMMAAIMPAFPQFIKFEAKEGEQTILEHGKRGTELYAKFTVKQLKED